MNIILNICVVAIILVGRLSVKTNGGITTGEIMAAITYVSMILHSTLFMANIFQTFTRAKASVIRINEVLECDSIINDGAFDGNTPCKGQVEFRHVKFSYPNSSGRKVLEDITLSIKQGETFAILGSTGSGKSSLVNLIPRFYDAAEGEVLVDNINVKEYNLKFLRDKIAIVLQKSELYSRSI
jgi:ATP-binding cassette subfamily B protein